MTTIQTIADWCASHNLPAFATGSFLRGNEDEKSDIDIIVLIKTTECRTMSYTGTVGQEQIESKITDRINRETDVQRSIDVNVHDMDNLEWRVQEGDPFAMTLLDDATPLSLSEETVEWLDELQEHCGTPNPKLTTEILQRNINSACINILQALLYKQYLLLEQHNRSAVPPKQLPSIIASLDDGNVEFVEQIIELKRLVETNAVSPRTALQEVFDLLEWSELCKQRHRR